jgi:hypothetical protein
MSRSIRALRHRPLAVGDLCLTCNSENSPRNNGLLVLIVEILRSSGGRLAAHPYRIRRIDGQPFPVLGGRGRPMHRDVFTLALTRARHLRRLAPDDAPESEMTRPEGSDDQRETTATARELA